MSFSYMFISLKRVFIHIVKNLSPKLIFGFSMEIGSVVILDMNIPGFIMNTNSKFKRKYWKWRTIIENEKTITLINWEKYIANVCSDLSSIITHRHSYNSLITTGYWQLLLKVRLQLRSRDSKPPICTLILFTSSYNLQSHWNVQQSFNIYAFIQHSLPRVFFLSLTHSQILRWVAPCLLLW